MEAIAVMAVLVLVIVVIGSVCGIIGVVLAVAQGRHVSRLTGQVEALEARLGKSRGGTGGEMPKPAPAQATIARTAAEARPAPAVAVPIRADAIPPAKPPQVPPVVPMPPKLKPDRERMSSIEEWIGKRWLTWVGSAALFLSMAFLVKYAIDNRWLGPTGRIALAILFGIILLVLGDRSVRRSMRILGLSLMGAGLAILYVAVYGGFKLYGLVSPEIAAGILIFFTVAGMTLALAHNAMSTAIIAVVGGFVTPVMVSTGVDSRDTLFAYVVLLDLGVFGVAFFKRWRPLDAIAFIGTVCLYSGWYAVFYKPAALAPALLWLSGFYAIFLLLPFAYHFRTGTPVAVERFVLALANGLFMSGYCYMMLYPDNRYLLGFIALGMGGFYALLGALIRRRVAEDVKTLFGFMALAVAFLTLAVPLQLRANGILLAWAVEGPVLLYLGYRFRYFPMRVFSFIVLALSAARLFVMHWPLHTAYFDPLTNPPFLSTLSVPIAGWIFAWIHSRHCKGGPLTADGVLKETSAIAAGLIAIVVLSAETGSWISFDLAPDSAAARALWPEYAVLAVCVAGAAAFLAAGIFRRSLASRVAGLLPLGVALLLSVWLFLDSCICWDESWPIYNIRFFLALGAIFLAYLYSSVLHRRSAICSAGEQIVEVALFWTAVALLLALVSAEAFDACRNKIDDIRISQWAAQMAVTLVWGGYAAAMLAVGFWRKRRPLRLTALGLFCAAALKLVLVDIAGVEQIYRIVAFVVLGLLMIAASYLYHRIEKRLQPVEGDKP